MTYDIFQPDATGNKYVKKTMVATADDLSGDKIGIKVTVDGQSIGDKITTVAQAVEAVTVVNKAEGKVVAPADLPTIIKEDISDGNELKDLKIAKSGSYIEYTRATTDPKLPTTTVDKRYLVFEFNVELNEDDATDADNYAIYYEKSGKFDLIKDEGYIKDITLYSDEDSSGNTYTTVALELKDDGTNPGHFVHAKKYQVLISENVYGENGEKFYDKKARTADITVNITTGAKIADKKVTAKIIEPKGLKKDTAVIGDTIEITVEFDQEIDVEKGTGTPTVPELAININDTGSSAASNVKAKFKEVSEDKKALIFEYVVVAGDTFASGGTVLEYLATTSLSFEGYFVYGMYSGVLR